MDEVIYLTREQVTEEDNVIRLRTGNKVTQEGKLVVRNGEIRHDGIGERVGIGIPDPTGAEHTKGNDKSLLTECAGSPPDGDLYVDGGKFYVYDPNNGTKEQVSLV